MKNILVPISFSETSKNTLSLAISIAKQYGSTLTLLHCYPHEDYNRVYDFGKEAYDVGIKKMLEKFYVQHVNQADRQKFKIITYEGSVSEVISKVSSQYDLLVLSRKIGGPSKSNKWFSDKIFYFTTKARCPVLLLCTKRREFTFSEMKTIWHVKRKANETEIILNKLIPFDINPELIATKSLQQETFVSEFWKNIVAYTKNHSKHTMGDISKSFEAEHLDLILLVNHRKGMFEEFVKDDAFQIISQFDIPILIFQANI